MSWRGALLVATVIGLLLVLVWEAAGPRQVAAAVGGPVPREEMAVAVEPRACVTPDTVIAAVTAAAAQIGAELMWIELVGRDGLVHLVFAVPGEPGRLHYVFDGGCLIGGGVAAPG